MAHGEEWGNDWHIASRYLLPVNKKTTIFSDRIKSISNSFVKYYSEAEEAENSSLLGICGMGYRKALEFLIKDYAQYLGVGKEDVEKSSLSECINNYIDEPRIKAAALASAWIGNDETHYVKKYEDKNLSDLKEFIECVVYYIEMDSRFQRSKEFIDNNTNKK